MSLFTNKGALITGAASGIGKACAAALAREGAKLALCDVAWGENGVTGAKELYPDSIVVEADVSSSSELQRFIQKVLDKYDRLHCAVNNAGVVGMLAPMTEYTEEAWDHVLDVNLKAVWRCMKEEIGHMVSHGGGSIVNVASAAGIVGLRGASAYVASKHGVIGLTKTAALEYAQAGVRVNAVCPGWIDTPMVERMVRAMPALTQQINAMEPIGRMGRPEEVAECVVWLCSEAASFVTGHAMIVDGGLVAQ